MKISQKRAISYSYYRKKRVAQEQFLKVNNLEKAYNDYLKTKKHICNEQTMLTNFCKRNGWKG